MPREKNFSEKDKQSLLDLIFLQRDIIENKETDRLMLVKKDEVWADITKNYNEKAIMTRSEKSLRYCWDNLKKAARKYCASLKRETYKTGINLNINNINKKMF